MPARARQSFADEAMAGMMLGVYGNAKAHKDVYFPTPGYYLTGDGAYRDEGWLLLDHGSHRRRDERVGPPHRHGRS